jgi:hypothetical protein
VIRRLKVSEGKIEFIDHSISPDGIKITANHINLTLSNAFMFSRYPLTNFALSATIPWKEGQEEGKITLDGWANFAKKDMQASLKITDIDGIYLYPYYAQWVDLGKARIDKAKLNFTSEIQGLNNEVSAQCHLELTDIVRRPLEEGQQEDKAAKVADQVLDIFKALNTGKIELNFTIHTKMDRPEFGMSSIRNAFEDRIQQAYDARLKPQDIFLLPSRIWEKGVQYGTDFSKAVFQGAVAVGNEIKKGVEEAAKKDTEDKEP